MTPQQADRIIKAGKPVTVIHTPSGEVFTRSFIYRDHWNIRAEGGGLFSRDDLKLVPDTQRQPAAQFDPVKRFDDLPHLDECPRV